MHERTAQFHMLPMCYHGIPYTHAECPLEIGPPNNIPPILEKKSKIAKILLLSCHTVYLSVTKVNLKS